MDQLNRKRARDPNTKASHFLGNVNGYKIQVSFYPGVSYHV